MKEEEVRVALLNEFIGWIRRRDDTQEQAIVRAMDMIAIVTQAQRNGNGREALLKIDCPERYREAILLTCPIY